MALFITTIGCYGLQSSDINVSLTGIGLLFSIADFLGKDGEVLVQTSTAEESVDRFIEPLHQASGLKSSTSSFTHSPIARLWISLFTEMKQLCLDQRFEVRNCSLITLIKTFTTHGRSLELDTWNKCTWDILIPMLEDIQSSTSAAATEEVSVELGKQGGRSVKLLVHHSRNSVQKQWNETVLLSYSGFTRILRTFASILVQLSTFDAIWARTVSLGEQLVLYQSHEVSESVIVSLRELLISSATQSYLSRSHWDLIWQTYENVVQKLSQNVPETLLAVLSSSFSQLYTNQRKVRDILSDDVF